MFAATVLVTAAGVGAADQGILRGGQAVAGADSNAGCRFE